MLLFRTSFCFYIFTLFFIFSSERAEKSLANVIAVKRPVRSGVNCSIKKYNNVKAIEVENKIFSKYLYHSDITYKAGKCTETLLKSLQVSSCIVSADIFCAVKSYLHLLKLF